jgi:hypothetical protein
MNASHSANVGRRSARSIRPHSSAMGGCASAGSTPTVTRAERGSSVNSGLSGPCGSRDLAGACGTRGSGSGSGILMGLAARIVPWTLLDAECATAGAIPRRRLTHAGSPGVLADGQALGQLSNSADLQRTCGTSARRSKVLGARSHAPARLTFTDASGPRETGDERTAAVTRARTRGAAIRS